MNCSPFYSRLSSFISIGLVFSLSVPQPILAEANRTAWWTARKTGGASVLVSSLGKPSLASVGDSLPLALEGFPNPRGVIPALQTMLAPVSPALGRWGVLHPPSVSPSEKTVFLVQDVHLNPTVQKNLSTLTQALFREQTVSLLALEGGFGAYRLGRFRRFSDRASLGAVVDSLLARQKISGPMHAALSTPQQGLCVLGVDNPYFYQANVESYRRSLALRPDAETRWAHVQKTVNERKKTLYPPALQDLSARVAENHAGRGDLGDYVHRLSQGAKPGPMTTRFLSVVDLESRLNLQELKADQRRLFDSLLTKLTPSQEKELTQEVLRFRDQTVSAKDFYSRLERIVLSKNRSAWTPGLAHYLDYLTKADGVDPSVLYTELQDLEDRAFAVHLTDPAVRSLREDDLTLELVQKLLKFQMTPDDWARYQPLRAKAKDLLSLNLSTFEQFYVSADARNYSLANNLRRAMDDQGMTRALLVTGGYHTEAVGTLLRSWGVATVTFSPRVGEWSGDSLAVFSKAPTTLDRLVESLHQMVSPPPVEAAVLDLGLALETAVRQDPDARAKTVRALAGPTVAEQITTVDPVSVTFAGDQTIPLISSDGPEETSPSHFWRDLYRSVVRWLEILVDALRRPMEPFEVTDLLNEKPLMSKSGLTTFFGQMTRESREKDLRRLQASLSRARSLLRRVRLQNDALRPLANGSQFSYRELDLLRAFSTFISQGNFEEQDPLERLKKIKQCFADHPDFSRALIRSFEERFQGAGVPSTVPEIPRGVDLFTESVFFQSLGLVRAVEKTNYFMARRTGVAFRFDPENLPLFQGNPTYPRLPHAVIWVYSPYGVQGAHVRMAPIARGGLRELVPSRLALRGTVLSESYALADTQQRKNVDIPRGGSKGAFIANTDLNEVASMIAYADGLMDLMGPEALLAVGTPHERWPDTLEFGPDEGTAVFPGLVTALALQRGLGNDSWRLMTGKPAVMGGVSHMSNDLLPDQTSNRVTSQGVMTHVNEVLKFIGLDSEAPIDFVFTGGLDGDVGSGDIRLAITRYGSRARILSVTDGSGVVFDPEGLDHKELLRLYALGAPQGALSSFNPEKLHRGGFLAAGATDAVLLSPETLASLARSPATMAPFEANAEGQLLIPKTWLQEHMIFLARANVFVPGGGRKGTINRDNVRWLLSVGEGGEPLFQAIVYGANVFTTPEANRLLENAGVVVIPDEKANSVGVEVSSRMEVDTNILWDNEDITVELQRDYIQELLPKLLGNAQRKHWAIQLAKRQHPEKILTGDDGLSAGLSLDILELKNLLLNADLDVQSDLSRAILRRYFSSAAGLERVDDRFSVPLLQEIIATVMADDIVYNSVGLKPLKDLAPTVSPVKKALTYMEVAYRENLNEDKQKLYDQANTEPKRLEHFVAEVNRREQRHQEAVLFALGQRPTDPPLPPQGGNLNPLDVPDPRLLEMEREVGNPWEALRGYAQDSSTRPDQPLARSWTVGESLLALQRYVVARVRVTSAVSKTPVLFRVVTQEDLADLPNLLARHREVRSRETVLAPWLLLTPINDLVQSRLTAIVAGFDGVSVRPPAELDQVGMLKPQKMNDDFLSWMGDVGLTEVQVTFTAPHAVVNPVWPHYLPDDSPFYLSLKDFIHLLLGGITVTLKDLEHLLVVALKTSQNA